MSTQVKAVLQITGLVIGIFLLCSGWVFGIVKDANAQSLNDCKQKIEKLEEKTIPEMNKVIMSHEKIIPVIETKLDYLVKSMERLLRNH